MDSDDLIPPVERRELPREARALREIAADEYGERMQELQPAIDAHLVAYAAAVQRLVDVHANIASGTDLGIGTDTRWSAIWELGGRCLSECRLLLHALRGGFSVESSANERAVFEAMHLLAAVAFDDDVLRKWLAGDYVRPKTARAVLARQQDLARQRMEVAGVDPEGDVVESGEWLYDYFSKAAHHRRGPLTGSVFVDRREFAYGPHPDPERRARETWNAGQTIDTALIVVADSLSHIVGRNDLGDFLADQAAALESVRREHPLTDEPD
ncbi:MAG: hypothetical protein WD067_10975 [Gaiellaceae bacterium]